MKKIVIITASGSGIRAGSNIPKQFLIINKKPVLFYTIEQFFNFSPEIEIILTLNKDYIEFWNKLVKQYSFSIKHKIVTGGKTRFESVKNAISTINEDSLVAIHDGVRPFVSANTISKCFAMANNKGNAVPYIEITDSIRKVDKNINFSVDRNNFVAIQTPQIFKSSLIKKAYLCANNTKYTDEASLLENINEKINLVKGNIENIKITTKYDLKISLLYAEYYKGTSIN